MLKLLDFFFTGFHTCLILFNIFGWIFRFSRKLNLITLMLTGASWFVLGLFYGIGYCPLTDWHFKILERMGKTDLPSSYIAYLTLRLTGIEFQATVVDRITLFIFLLSLSLSVYFNVWYGKKRTVHHR